MLQLAVNNNSIQINFAIAGEVEGDSVVALSSNALDGFVIIDNGVGWFKRPLHIMPIGQHKRDRVVGPHRRKGRSYPEVAEKSHVSDRQFLVTETQKTASSVAVTRVRISALTVR